MRARVWAPVTVGVLLVVGVLGVRGGSAADEADLAGPPPLSPTVEPSPGSSEPDSAGEALLAADGVGDLRLGGPSSGLITPDVGFGGGVTAADLPGGCLPGYEATSDARRTWDARVWLVDDLIASIMLTRSNPNLATSAGLRTWLGPTLGSPIEAASELPGAETRTERPFGASGPSVRVVVVEADGVEVVYSDATYDMDAVPEQARGRVTTIEVRRPEARACSQEALSGVYLASLGTPAADPVVGLDGLVGAPIGSAAEALDDLPGAQPEASGPEGCQSYVLAAGEGVVRVVTVDGVVVSASIAGEAKDETYGDLPFRIGMSAEDAAAAVPAGAVPTEGSFPGNLAVQVGQRLVQADLLPPTRWVEDLDQAVSGAAPAVSVITVSDSAVKGGLTNC